VSKKPKGKLIIVGGNEDRDGDQVILEEVCQEAGKRDGAIVVVTVATQEPEKIAKEYTGAFKG
jgi:cyanophycinase